jgi:arginase family enzyme
VEGIQRALDGTDRVYVALDWDVLDPDESVRVFMPEPAGLSLAEVEAIAREVAERVPVAGAGLTGLVADASARPALERACAALGL